MKKLNFTKSKQWPVVYKNLFAPVLAKKNQDERGERKERNNKIGGSTHRFVFRKERDNKGKMKERSADRERKERIIRLARVHIVLQINCLEERERERERKITKEKWKKDRPIERKERIISIVL